jgi:hypothetical protein
MTQNDTMRASDNGAARHPDKTRRLQRKRRVKRGIVASYIHELSGRHREGAAGLEPAAQEAVEPAPAG